MTGREQSPDIVLRHSNYKLHLRRASHEQIDKRGTAHVHRVRWQSESPSHDTILWLLAGNYTWQLEKSESASDEAQAEEARAPAALIVDQNARSAVQSKANSELLILSFQPATVIDAAVRAKFIRADAQVRFRSQLVSDDERLIRFGRDLRDELVAAETGADLTISALIESTCVHLLRRYADFRRSPELELSRVGLVDRRIRRSIELMHAHLDRDLPLEQLATAAYLSEFHFARLFKKLTGDTPHAYLAALRIAEAERLLSETDLSIIQISQRVGYNSPNHFSRAFRLATGFTPRAFRHALVR